MNEPTIRGSGALSVALPGDGPGTFRVATFNVENYLDGAFPNRRAKSAESKSAVRESIRVMNPDVLALQEMGSVAALMELRDSLAAEGVEYPFWEHVVGMDADLHIAILSKFPFTARRPRADDSYLLKGRCLRVRRGFGEVEIQPDPGLSFTLLSAHLKSHRTAPEGDASELRLEEARLLRERIDTLLAGNSNAKLIVVGDFNDSPDSNVVKGIIGEGEHRLIDICPGEGNGNTRAALGSVREGAWTNCDREKLEYDRFDYLLVSSGMDQNLVARENYVLATSNWALASNHRPIVASFCTVEAVAFGGELI
jgi:endonuclease/exonuclease/phosphatase family metal-dependent hydrolase